MSASISIVPADTVKVAGTFDMPIFLAVTLIVVCEGSIIYLLAGSARALVAVCELMRLLVR